MGNPVFDRYGQNAAPTGPFSNMQNMMQQFQQFRQSFQGDARAQVQELLNSGKMSQEQFNQLSNMANQFWRMMGGGR